MATRSGGNDRRSIVILDPDDGSPVIVIAPQPATPEKSHEPLPGREVAPPADKKK